MWGIGVEVRGEAETGQHDVIGDTVQGSGRGPGVLGDELRGRVVLVFYDVDEHAFGVWAGIRMTLEDVMADDDGEGLAKDDEGR